jgi:hypothetical protein
MGSTTSKGYGMRRLSKLIVDCNLIFGIGEWDILLQRLLN